MGTKSAAALIAEAVAKMNEPPPIPDGWITGEQYAQELGISLSHARKILCDAVRAGVVKRQKHPIIRPGGGPVNTTIYRVA